MSVVATDTIAPSSPLAVAPSYQARGGVQQFPVEILLMVFRSALLPSWLLCPMDWTLPPFPQSPWSADLRTKLAVVAVCRSWYHIGIELLYERVTLRRFTQIPSFIAALESRERLGALVRSLDFNFYVPPELSGHWLESNTGQIFQLCPRLSHFGFSAHPDPMDLADLECLLPVPTHSEVTSLHFNRPVQYATILPILVKTCRSLRSLTFSLSTLCGEPQFGMMYARHTSRWIAEMERRATHPTLIFDNLEDLHLLLGDWHSSISSKYLMPRLRRVWLDGNLPLQALEILKPCGRTITFLSLTGAHSQLHIQQLLNLCPALEHLGIKAPNLRPVGLTHKTINWIDVYSKLSCDQDDVITFEWLHQGFPALRTVRRLNEEARHLSAISASDLVADSKSYVDSVSWSDRDSHWIAAMMSTFTDSESDGYADDDRQYDGGFGMGDISSVPVINEDGESPDCVDADYTDDGSSTDDYDTHGSSSGDDEGSEEEGLGIYYLGEEQFHLFIGMLGRKGRAVYC